MNKTKFELYFVLNGGDELKGEFKTRAEAWAYMRNLVRKKVGKNNRIYWSLLSEDNKQFVEYGFSNEKFYVKEIFV